MESAGHLEECENQTYLSLAIELVVQHIMSYLARLPMLYPGRTNQTLAPYCYRPNQTRPTDRADMPAIH